MNILARTLHHLVIGGLALLLIACEAIEVKGELVQLNAENQFLALAPGEYRVEFYPGNFFFPPTLTIFHEDKVMHAFNLERNHVWKKDKVAFSAEEIGSDYSVELTRSWKREAELQKYYQMEHCDCQRINKYNNCKGIRHITHFSAIFNRVYNVNLVQNKNIVAQFSGEAQNESKRLELPKKKEIGECKIIK